MITCNHLLFFIKSLQFLDDPVFLASICRTQFERFYEFVDANDLEANGGNISKADRVKFIDWEKAKGVLMDKRTTKPVSDVYRAKLACKSDYEMFYLTDNKTYLDMAEERARWHDLEEWMDGKKEHWCSLYEWRKDQRFKGAKRE